MGLYFITNDDLFKAQKDVLWTDVGTNTLMTASGVATLNQKFNTSNKKVIGAVNELLVKTDKATDLAKDSVDTMRTVLGDVVGDETMKSKLEQLGGNVLNAMYELKSSVEVLEKKEVIVSRIDGGVFGAY